MSSHTSSVYGVDQSTPLLGAETINLVSGSSFIVCSRDGWIRSGGLQGYYSGDSRVLSSLHLLIDGQIPFPVDEVADERSVSVKSIIGDPAHPSLLLTHHLHLGEILKLTLVLENLTALDATHRLELVAAGDFADIFEVKRGDRPREGFVGSGPSEGDLVLSFESGDFRRGLRISCDIEHHVLRDGLDANVQLAPRSQMEIHVTMVAEAARYQQLLDRHHAPIGPTVVLPEELRDSRWLPILQRSIMDIDSLRMIDPLQLDRPVIAAGSPWFLALFGRDSLITAWELLHLDGDLALNVLESLALRQGKNVVAETDEQPGRILHEVRGGEASRRGWGSTYYGSVDATCLFIIVLAAVDRLREDARVRALLPAAESCLGWVDHFGDGDGDGLIEFPGKARGIGLDNQAWKDSIDAVRHRDGSLAEGPIAMVEVQGYLHRALIDLAYLRERHGGDAKGLLQRADLLREQIHDQFWMPDEECFAIALDGRKERVGGVSSNAGHLLWSGTAYDDEGQRLSRRLMAPDMFTGFGLRTLSSDNPGYNPMSYHCGSVWPHDTALIAAGMAQYNAMEQAKTLGLALMDAADEETGRLPELFGGFDRADHHRPVPYPASCSPQAWAAAAPLLLARFLP